MGIYVRTTVGSLAGGRLVMKELSGPVQFTCHSCGSRRFDYRVTVLDDDDNQLVCSDCTRPLAERLQ